MIWPTLFITPTDIFRSAPFPFEMQCDPTVIQVYLQGLEVVFCLVVFTHKRFDALAHALDSTQKSKRHLMSAISPSSYPIALPPASGRRRTQSQRPRYALALHLSVLAHLFLVRVQHHRALFLGRGHGRHGDLSPSFLVLDPFALQFPQLEQNTPALPYSTRSYCVFCSNSPRDSTGY